MESQFENRYTSTRKMVAEFGRKHAVGPRPWTLALLPVVLLIAWFYFSEDNYIMCLYWCAVLLLVQLLPQYYAWAAERNTKRLNDGMVPPVTVSFGDTIELEEGVTRLTVHYRNIRRVVRLKRSYVLLTSRRTGVMLREDGFTKGTFPEFKQFLREKRPDLNIPE